jgi:hypothetical protein
MSAPKKTGRSTQRSRGTNRAKKVSAPLRQLTVTVRGEERFDEVVALSDAASGRAYEAVNSELVSLYLQLGEYMRCRRRRSSPAIALCSRSASPQ